MLPRAVRADIGPRHHGSVRRTTVPPEETVHAVRDIHGKLLAAAARALCNNGGAGFLRYRTVDPRFQRKGARAGEIENPEVGNSHDVVATIGVAGETWRAV